MVAGDPDASKLWRVISDERLPDDPPVMPFGTGPLEPETIEHVRLWILAGAPLGDTDEDADGYSLSDGDCDGLFDEGLTERAWADADHDGYGDPRTPIAACPGEGASNALDCDDTTALAHPGGTEICDGVDADCDDVPDDDAIDASSWFDDADGDGDGDPSALTRACTQPQGTTNGGTDCDDTDAAVNPGVPIDGLNGIDDDCDGAVDEDGVATTSHAADIQPIWDSLCTTSCHGAPVPAGGLSLKGDAWPNLVNKPSGQAPLDYVEPFSPEQRYLWHRVNGTQLSVGGTGSTTPKTGRKLSAAELQLVQTWIREGAPR